MAVQLSHFNEPFNVMGTYGTEMEMEENSIMWHASAGTAMEGREDIIGS